jgi:tRNA pseudouridine65 synthase
MQPIMTLPVLFQDRDLVVVSKPAGLLVHRTKLAADGDAFAMQMVRDQIGAQVFPVHRLDRPTSGALIFALSKEAARAISDEFTARRVSKNYLAVVRGVLKSPSVRVDYPLFEELDERADSKSDPNKDAQEAITDFELLAQAELPVQVDRYPTSRYCLVRARPLTGRKHQIRRHLRHLGHPVVGDVNHGVGKHNRFFQTQFGSRRLLLACTQIAFRHPSSRAVVEVKAPLSPEFSDVLSKLGWSDYVEV